MKNMVKLNKRLKGQVLLFSLLLSFASTTKSQVNKDSGILYDTLQIERIDSIRNHDVVLINNVLIIYAVSSQGKHYKICSHYDSTKDNEDDKVLQLARWYRIPLVSILQKPLSKIGAQYLRAPGIAITGTSYFGNSILIEPDRGIYDLHIVPELNGLFFSHTVIEPFRFDCCTKAINQELNEQVFHKNADHLLMQDSNEQSMPKQSFLPDVTELHESDEIFEDVQEGPMFPGGEKALLVYTSNTAKCPISAIFDDVQAKVNVSFVIEKDGSVSNVEIVEFENVFRKGQTKEHWKMVRNITEEQLLSINSDIKAEAEHVVKIMPKWIPGKKDGKVVRAKITIPINFLLD